MKRTYVLIIFSYITLFFIPLTSYADRKNFGVIAPPSYKTLALILKEGDEYNVKLNRRDKMFLRKLRKVIYSIILNQQSIISKSMNEPLNRVSLTLKDDPEACFVLHPRCCKYVSSFYIAKNLSDIDVDKFQDLLYQNFPQRVPNCLINAEEPEKCIAAENNVDIILYVDFILSPENFDRTGRIKSIDVMISSLLYETKVVQNRELTINRREKNNFNYLQNIITEKVTDIIKESLETLRATNSIRNLGNVRNKTNYKERGDKSNDNASSFF